MADINPFEQPPVYKSDQVITQADLRNLWKLYETSEGLLMIAGRPREAETACRMHKMCEFLLEWLNNGKKNVLEIGDENGFDSEI